MYPVLRTGIAGCILISLKYEPSMKSFVVNPICAKYIPRKRHVGYGKWIEEEREEKTNERKVGGRKERNKEKVKKGGKEGRKEKRTKRRKKREGNKEGRKERRWIQRRMNKLPKMIRMENKNS